MKTVFGLLILCALAWSSRSSEQTPVTGIDPCLSQPCENGGTCVFDNNTSYRCDCAAGFVGTECHDVDCGNQQFMTEAMEITSPFYPQQYPLYKRCSYRLESEPGKLIEVKFSKFALENSHECKKDFVDIFDGGDTLSPIINNYCGNQTPETILTSGPRLFIEFRSDGSVVDGGFHLTATPIDDDGTPSSTRTDYTAKEDDRHEQGEVHCIPIGAIVTAPHCRVEYTNL
ncbi:bone morphogenetic protein 1-like [Ptychodera flava]|uniref:bone morphogenetic protein 1-like n=1 Tax=Ptychodera flava TaxID=63121 RepID=UPI00396A457F